MLLDLFQNPLGESKWTVCRICRRIARCEEVEVVAAEA